MDIYHPLYYPLSCCQIEEENPTSTGCLAIILPNHPGSPVLQQDPCMSGWSGEVLRQDPLMSGQTGEDDPISTSCIALSQVTHDIGIMPFNLAHLPPPKRQPHAWLVCSTEAITPAPW